MRRQGRREGGAALVEFALVAPLLFMLIFGIITGGIAYDRNLAVSYAAQQAARFAATLPMSAYDTEDEWFDAVLDHAITNGTGALDEGVNERELCVAYISAGHSAARSMTTLDVSSPAGETCYGELDEMLASLPPGEARVQVSLARGANIDLVVFGTIDLTLSREVTTRYEVDDV